MNVGTYRPPSGNIIQPGEAPHQQFLEKLWKLQLACNYVQKDGRNTFHQYNYASAAGVLEKVSDALQLLKLTSWTETWVERVMDKTTAKGGHEFVAIVGVRLHLICIETGAGVVISAHGSGQDPGDKALMKAQTAALKYAWMMALNMSTGDDPEADTDTDRRNAGKDKPKPVARGAYQGGEARSSAPADQKGYGEALAYMQEHHRFCKCKAPMAIGFSVEKKKFYFNCLEVVEQLALAKNDGERTIAIKEDARANHDFRWAPEVSKP